MSTVYEYAPQGTEAFRIFLSHAAERKNSLRIHHHVTVELSLVLKGQGVYQSEGRVYTMEAGDVFLFRPNEPHCVTDVNECGITLLNIHITPSFLYSAFPQITTAGYGKIFTKSFVLPSHKVSELMTEDTANNIRQLIMETKNECERESSGFLVLTVNYLTQIFICISRACPPSGSQTNTGRAAEKMVCAMFYMNEHFCESITLDKVAAHVGYSRCYFSQMFRDCFGMSPWDYISIKRIEKALGLIKTTNMSMLQIASECGFNNTSNFNKTFRKYTHLSPREYRK